jgi:phosphohistidine phosphatase
MLWLLRHAEAQDGTHDDERPLTDRGARQARAVGLALRRLEVHLDACLCSPKVRARQTAELACEPIGVAVSPTPALAGEPFDVADLTAGLDDVLLVGHDPSFSMTLHDLTGVQTRLPKSGLAGVRKGELIVLMRPHELETMAGVELATAEGVG